MQTQVNTLESEVLAQLELVRAEMAETRKELLDAIGVFTQSNSSEIREDINRSASQRSVAVGTWGRRQNDATGIGFGTAAAIVAQTTSTAAAQRRRRPSFD